MEFFLHSCYLETEHMLPAAQAAEAAGFDGIDISDHVVQPEDLGSSYPYDHDLFPRDTPWTDTWVLVGALATGTTTLKFTNHTYILPMRHPVQAARQISSAAALSNYRLYPAVAAGWMMAEFEVFGVDFKTRFSRTDESIEIMRKLWDGGYVEHHGKHFDFPRLQMCPTPKQRIPIWGSGDYPTALARAARLDGYFGALYDVDSGRKQLAAIQQARVDAGTADRQDYTLAFGYLSDHSCFPTLEECKQFEEMGLTMLSVTPFFTEYPPENRDPGLDKVLRCIDEFGSNVISKM